MSRQDDTVERARARARARAAAVLTEPAPPTAERRPRRARRIVWPVLVSIAFVGVLFVAVFPTQTYLEKRREIEARQERLAEVEAEAAELQQRVEDLQGDEAIELIAREEWGFVFPGEEAYAIVGLGEEPPPPTTAPDAAPAGADGATPAVADRATPAGGGGTTPATATTGTD